MPAIAPEEFFATLAVVVAIGFVLDYFFRRTRIPSVLPLMLLGLVFVQVGIVSPQEVADFHAIGGYIAAFGLAVIILLVGLEMDLSRLYAVAGRSAAWTFVCQIATATATALLIYGVFHWPLLWAVVFGFALSGPSSVVVQALIRHYVMKEELKTALLFEAVLTDILELIAPLVLIEVYLEDSANGLGIAGLVSYTILGSVALGVVAGFVWVWALDRGRAVSAGFTWGLTVTIALGLFAVATYTELSGALVIFLFGVIVGNAALWDYRRRATSGTSHGGAARALDWVRRSLRLDSTRVPVTEIATMQRQVTYIAATFFFFYIGVLFVYPVPNFALILAVPAVAVAVMVLLRLCLTPILAPYLSPEPRTRRRERVIIAMNVPRGLAGAAIAAIVLALPGVVLPGFSNLVFIVILLTNVVATIAIFVFSQPSDGRPELREAGRGAGEWPSA